MTEIFSNQNTICEVYGEWIRDLLDPKRESLQVEMDGTFGPTVKGLSSIWVSDQESILAAIQRAQQNRLGDNTDASAKSFVFYYFDVANTADHQELQSNTSLHVALEKVTIEVIFTILDRILLFDCQVMLLNVRAFAFQKHPQDQNLPSATRLLFDELGGNCQTCVVFSLDTAASNSSNLAILDFSEVIRQISTYPVRNDANFMHIMSIVRHRSPEIYKLTFSNAICSAIISITMPITTVDPRLNSLIEKKAAVEQSLASKDEELLQAKKMLLETTSQKNVLVESSEKRFKEVELPSNSLYLAERL
eukprot:jgi/Hompol1/394/HPOL_001325-RA